MLAFFMDNFIDILKIVIGFMFFLRNIKCKTKQRANNEKGWESSLKNYIYLSNVVLQ